MRKLFLSLLLTSATSVYALPSDFVYLNQVAPDILQEIRYAGSHNFVGRPVNGYQAPTCVLTREAAKALKAVQTALKRKSFTLKVYDCYRPTRAVQDFMAWSQDPSQQQMKPEFYPEINKADMFKLGYVAEQSGHSRGSTIDITIVPIPVPHQPKFSMGQKLIACTAGYKQRYADNTIDMGTGYDCMDEMSFPDNKKIGPQAQANRMLLRAIMMQNGFVPYDKEWWHFTLSNEPFPKSYFNFVVE